MVAKTPYLTVDEAIIYFSGRLETDEWDDAEDLERNKALIQASTDIDKLQYAGQKSVAQQEHEFPRLNADHQFDQNVLDADNVPMDIKYAVCEQALALLQGWNVSDEIDGLSTVSVAYGPLKSSFDREDVPMHLKCGLCPQAWQYILPYLVDSRNVKMVRMS